MRYLQQIETTADPKTALGFAANFLNLPIWDPSVSGARKLTRGRVRKGTRFLVRFDFLGISSDLFYEVTTFDQAKGATLVAETALMKATDTVTVEPCRRGSTVRWEADIQLALPLIPFDPVLTALFAGSVEQAVRNLEHSLDELARRESTLERPVTWCAGASAMRRKAA